MQKEVAAAVMDAQRPRPGDDTSPDPVPTISYVVPAHNSTAIIGATLEALAERLAARQAEVIVVENGSTDATADLLAQIEKSWPHSGVPLIVLRSAKGLGNAYRTGIAASTGTRVLLTADDLPFGFDDLAAADRLEPADHPLIIGSKAHPDSDVARGWLRGLLTWGFAMLRRVILGMHTGDPQGTYVMAGDWARTTAARLEEQGYLVTTELAYLAERQGIRPLEVPVRLAASHRAHSSRIAVRDVVEMGAGLLRIRRRHAGAPTAVLD